MTTFYVAPSRQLLGQHFGAALGAIFPSATRAAAADWSDLGEALAALLEERFDAIVAYREDFDETLNLREVLTGHFGAAADDAIIPINLGTTMPGRQAA